MVTVKAAGLAAAVTDFAPAVGPDTAVVPALNGLRHLDLLTGASEEEFGLMALRAGAVGFLSKDIQIESLPRALRAVRDGEGAVSRAMTRRLIEKLREGPNGASGLRPIKGPLTPREWEVIELFKPGHSTDHVADTLVLSPETVRSHIKNIMRKLGVHSRADAVAAADRLRLAPTDRAG